jgi:hypothetical protein
MSVSTTGIDGRRSKSAWALTDKEADPKRSIGFNSPFRSVYGLVSGALRALGVLPIGIVRR